jgi:3-oxoacyl-(acyl-carrier-protein) synthase
MEAKLIGELFGEIPVAAYKSKTGECYGASPALSLTCALADLRGGRVSGVSDDYAALEGVNLVRGTQEAVQAEHVVVNAFSCDGNCSSAVIRNVS